MPSVGGFDEHATPSGGKYRSGAAGGSCWGCAVTLVVVLTGDPNTGQDLASCELCVRAQPGSAPVPVEQAAAPALRVDSGEVRLGDLQKCTPGYEP